MTITMYQASVPVFVRALTNLKATLQKRAQHAQARKLDPTVLLLTDRLFPDMFNLTRQVQLAIGLPNFFFHTTTAYAILRHNGVELGKSDFLGKLD